MQVSALSLLDLKSRGAAAAFRAVGTKEHSAVQLHEADMVAEVQAAFFLLGVCWSRSPVVQPHRLCRSGPASRFLQEECPLHTPVTLGRTGRLF